ncbi:hypothetical protein CBR_g12374 [Chara braunii]|uniref:Uncharacterized protein n=1 Tax=Chara braunii TaxID=69332 RepID=A0A388KRY4_CHABU|nr:hypothetical protein CBR_g12374 [Chara braunii]|eukprot:GBG72807.1 hypothetical protein CBR_g12374 [Chara braunii]
MENPGQRDPDWERRIVSGSDLALANRVERGAGGGRGEELAPAGLGLSDVAVFGVYYLLRLFDLVRHSQLSSSLPSVVAVIAVAICGTVAVSVAFAAIAALAIAVVAIAIAVVVVAIAASAIAMSSAAQQRRQHLATMAASYSPLSAFLNKEVPGWDDDVISNARFKAFGSRTDEGWKERMEFWMALIIRGARHLGLVVINAEEVKKTWFLRKGLTPLGLDDVLERVEDVLQNLQLIDGSTVPSDCIVTMEKFVKACGSYEEANLVLSYLILDRKAQRFTAQGRDSIEGLKFTVRAAKNGAVSENDRRILVLHHTASLLQHRYDNLGQRAEESRLAASAAAKVKDKVAALRHLRRYKSLASNRESCLRFLEKIEHVLGVISEAETSKQDVYSVRVKPRTYSAGMPAMPDEELDALEEEFAQLEAQLMPHRKETVVGEEKPEQPTAALSVMEDAVEQKSTAAAITKEFEEKRARPAPQHTSSVEVDDVQNKRIPALA